ncbi:MAG: hypothetical protein ACTSQE_04680 [Candidatus Heimdallarchaeaceae archaeon]
MVSDVMQQELKYAYERIRFVLLIIVFWLILSLLCFSNIVNFLEEGENFTIYAIMSSSSTLLLILSLGIQIEPLVKGMLNHRKQLNEFWEREEKLEPDIYKRALISEIILTVAVLTMMVGLLFVSV